MDTENRMVVRYLKKHPSHAAHSVERLQPEEISAVLESVPVGAAAGLLAALTPALAARCLSVAPATTASSLIRQLPAHLAAGLLRRLNADDRTALLAELPLHTRDRLRRLLRYSDNTVGALMDLGYFQVFGDCTVRDVQEIARERHESGVVYVVTREQQLLGATNMRALEDLPADATAAESARMPITTLSPQTDYSVAAAHACWLEVDEVPIISREGILLGILYHRTLRLKAGEAQLSSGDGLETAMGLGEVVWLGLHGLVDTVMTATAAEVRHDS
jgi:Mg/Co/Ni transporter MgtE